MDISIQKAPSGSNGIIKRFVFDKGLLNTNYLEGDDVLKNLSDYSLKLSKNKSLGGRGKQTFNRLSNFKLSLENKFSMQIDPLEYLIQLYYGEGLSIKDIFYRINKLGFNYSTKGKSPETVLHNLFTKTFGWKLRQRGEYTSITEKRMEKLLPLRVKVLQTTNIRQAEETEFVVKAYTDLLLYRNKILDLSEKEKEEFNKIENKSNGKKLVYLLNKFFDINLNNLLSLRTNHYLSYEKLSIIFNEIFKYIPSYLGEQLTVNKRVVRTIFEYKNKSN